jgi:hypothetical protein
LNAERRAAISGYALVEAQKIIPQEEKRNDAL